MFVRLPKNWVLRVYIYIYTRISRALRARSIPCVNSAKLLQRKAKFGRKSAKPISCAIKILARIVWNPWRCRKWLIFVLMWGPQGSPNQSKIEFRCHQEWKRWNTWFFIPLLWKITTFGFQWEPRCSLNGAQKRFLWHLRKMMEEQCYSERSWKHFCTWNLRGRSADCRPGTPWDDGIYI